MSIRSTAGGHKGPHSTQHHPRPYANIRNIRSFHMAVQSSQRQSSLAQNGLRPYMQGTLGILNREPSPPAQPKMGFFTDTSLCIGCKACEVACKQWNQLPAKEPGWTGTSYDNTGHLSAIAWRHVQFIEEIGQTRPALPLIEEQITPFTSHKRGIDETWR